MPAWLTMSSPLSDVALTTVHFAGIGFAPVSARMSMVLSAPAEVVWATVSKFGKQALWM